MAFQDTAESFKAKHHLSSVKTPVLIGVCALCIALLFFIFQGLWSAFDTKEFVVEKKSDAAAAKEPSAEEDASSPKTLYVHIGGAVVTPGVYPISEGSRVHDVVNAAGGFTDEADGDANNLARVVKDGEQILIPTRASTSSQGTQQSVTAPAQGKVNINTASRAELETLPGIGSATASKIITYREQHGPFQALEGIQQVVGIGEKKYAEIVDRICL